MALKDGKPCRKCGTNDWYDWGKCKHCHRKRARQYYESNREKAAEYNREWQRNNPEKVRERNKRWEKKNPKKVKARRRRWLRNNPEKNRESTKRWVQNNPEKAKEVARKWRKRNPDADKRWRRNNPEKVAAKKHRRRARKAQAGGSFTASEWKALKKQYGNRCLACGKKAKLTVDHVIPIIAGGNSDISNIQPLCLSCNDSKGINTIDYRTKPGIKRWIQERLL